jgi:hypothetical protein
MCNSVIHSKVAQDKAEQGGQLNIMNRQPNQNTSSGLSVRQTIHVLEIWLGNTGRGSGHAADNVIAAGQGEQDFRRSGSSCGLEVLKSAPSHTLPSMIANHSQLLLTSSIRTI